MASRVLIIVGPTSSGKSELAVWAAQKFNGEIISADSRQVYRGMNIGSGKVEGLWNNQGQYLYKNVAHYCIDFVAPIEQYSVAKFQQDGRKAFAEICAKNKLPIICGGTGMWIDALVYNYQFPKVSPNNILRDKLNKLTTQELVQKFSELHSVRQDDLDIKNRHRLIRAIEIASEQKNLANLKQGAPLAKQIIWVGINPPPEVLQQNILTRLKERLGSGMIKEVQNLFESGVSWKRLESFGLEYKWCALYLQGLVSQQELEQKLFSDIQKYSKRQLTWWKRSNNIFWAQTPDLAKQIIADKL